MKEKNSTIHVQKTNFANQYMYLIITQWNDHAAVEEIKAI